MTLSITPLFAGLLIVVQVFMTAFVGLYRVKSGIEFLDGGNVTMTRRMRAHGNFTETVPIALLVMVLAELLGAPAVLLWAGGAVLLIGRLMHAYTIVKYGTAVGRAIGMAMTTLPMAAFGVFLIWAMLDPSGI
ncbi:MAPEG family protein [Pelagibius sp. Alg239-R121]|uniref:MAPEG family protein n=1 Tax=Pelagibius sp. Alg239-R121 TaxID=2993448 RepID=UPI0024A65E00|nr:MAPEG family protein [Pelagibius sp. Alg239-R121]